jgi:hemerythrin superfamily protein
MNNGLCGKCRKRPVVGLPFFLRRHAGAAATLPSPQQYEMPHGCDQPAERRSQDAACIVPELADTTHRAQKTRPELLARIAREIKVHSKIEEEIFYPAFKQAGEKSDDAKMFFEAMEEHHAAGDLVLPHLLDTDVQSDQFGGRAQVLKELIEHHAGEEEKDMFPRARELLGKDVLIKLGERMQARKDELMRAMPM